MKSKRAARRARKSARAAEDNIPTLTDIVAPGPARWPDERLVQLRTDLSGRVLQLSEELVREAARDLETLIVERVCDELRMRLPGIIDEALRARLK